MNPQRIIVKKDVLDELLIGTYLMSDSPRPVWEMPWMARGNSDEPVSPTYDSGIILSLSPHTSVRFPWDRPTSDELSYNSPSTSTDVDSMVLSQGYEPSVRKVKGLMVVADPESVKRQRRKAVLEETQRVAALEMRTTVDLPADFQHSTSPPPVKYTPAYRDPIPTHVSPTEMKAIADLFTRKSPVQIKHTEDGDVSFAKVHPLINASGEKQRSKKDLATIAAMFCVETQEQAVIRRLKNQKIDHDENIGDVGHVKDDITISDVMNDENENIVYEKEKIDDNDGEIIKEKKQKKKRNVFVRFYRYMKRKFIRK